MPLLSFVVLLVIGLAGYGWWASDERAIERRLHRLADTLSVAEDDAEIARVARVAQLRGYFAPDVRIAMGSRTVTSRDALLGLVGLWTPPPGGLSVEFVDVAVTLPEGGGSARVYLTAKASTRDPGSGEPTVDAREVNLTMEKQDGEWVLTGVETADTLQHP